MSVVEKNTSARLWILVSASPPHIVQLDVIHTWFTVGAGTQPHHESSLPGLQFKLPWKSVIGSNKEIDGFFCILVLQDSAFLHLKVMISFFTEFQPFEWTTSSEGRSSPEIMSSEKTRATREITCFGVHGLWLPRLLRHVRTYWIWRQRCWPFHAG